MLYELGVHYLLGWLVYEGDFWIWDVEVCAHVLVDYFWEGSWVPVLGLGEELWSDDEWGTAVYYNMDLSISLISTTSIICVQVQDIVICHYLPYRCTARQSIGYFCS